MRRLAVLALIVAAMPFLLAAAPRRGSTFEVNALAVVDDAGRIRAGLAVENGEPGRLLLDEKGVVRTAHCALGWLRADASGRRVASAGKPGCLPALPAEAPASRAVTPEKE